MEGHHRDFDRAQAERWNYLACHKEIHNFLKRDIQIDGLYLHTQINTGRELLTHASLHLLQGRRYGLIGRNGVGKTTLLKAIRNRQIMGLYEHLRICYIDDGQEVEAGTTSEGDDTRSLLGEGYAEEGTALAYLLSRHEERLRLLKQLQAVLEHGGEEGEAGGEGAESSSLSTTFEQQEQVLEEIVATLHRIGSDDATGRAEKILRGMSVDPAQPMQSLSGGWRRRVALAAALFVDVDVLLLDEPTNHLDLRAVAWLEEFLQHHATSTTVVVVSHDTAFLDAFTTDIIALEGNTLVYVHGNYSHFLQARAMERQKHERMYRVQEARRRRLQQRIENLQARASAEHAASSYGQIRSLRQLLKHRLGASLDGTYWKYGLMGPRPEVLAPLNVEPFEFVMPTDVSDVPPGSGEGETLLLRLRDVGFSYAREPPTEESSTEIAPLLLRNVSLDVTLSTRLGLLGANGSGKTTLLKLLSGALTPTEGDRIEWSGCRMATLPQHAVAGLRSITSQTALQYVQDAYAQRQSTAATRCDDLGDTLDSKDARHLLGGFGLVGLDAEETPVGKLSDGQRARVLLASMLSIRPHVLLLDEPTSHLDGETRSALIDSLQSFEGAIIVSSHDRMFLDEVTTSRYCVDPWMAGPYERRAADYAADILTHLQQQVLLRNGHPSCSKAVTATVPHGASSHLDAPEVTAEEREAFHQTVVKCRTCHGNHFTHSCPEKPVVKPAVVKERPVSGGTKPKPAPAPLPPTRERATDGEGDWTVFVSKGAKRRIAKGK